MKSLFILKISLLTKINHILLWIKEIMLEPIKNFFSTIIIRTRLILSGGKEYLNNLIVAKEPSKIRKIKLVIVIFGLLLLSVFLIIEISPFFLKEELIIRRYIQRADYLYEEDKYQKAKGVYQKIVRKFPREKEAEWSYYRISQSYQKLRLFPQAIISYQKFLQQYPYSEYLIEGKYNLAYSYQEMGDLEKATQILRKTIDEFPQSEIAAGLHLALANCLFQQSKTEQSVSVYQKIIRRYSQQPQSAQAYLKLGDIYLKRKRYSEAILSYTSFLKRYPYSEGQDRALFSLAQCYLLQKEMEKALSMFSLLVNKFPQSKFSQEALFITGDIFYEKGEYDKSLNVFRTITEENQATSSLLNKVEKKIAQVYLMQKEYSKAIDVYEQMLNHPYFQDEDKIYFELANLYSRVGRYHQSEIAFREFVQYFPLSEDIPLAYFELGNCLYKQNLYFQGIESLQEITKQNASEELKGKAFVQIGEGYATLTLWKEAIDAFQQSLSYLGKEEISSVKYEIGRCYGKLGDFSAAGNIFSSLLQNSSKEDLSYQSYLEMGNVLGKGKKEEKKMALEMFSQAIDESLSQEQAILALYEIGRIEEELDLITSAMETYGEIIYLSSQIDSPQVLTVREKTYFHLADVYYSRKEYRKARSLYTRVVEEFSQGKDTSWALYQTGNTLRHLGEYQEAERFYIDLTKKFGNSFWSEMAKINLEISFPILASQ